MPQAQKMETPDNWAVRMTKEMMTVWLAKVKASGEPSPSEVLVKIARR